MCYSPPVSGVATAPKRQPTLRHSAVVRVTHWLTTIAFLALLITGGEIVISHPRFYWGEVGNVNTTPLFSLPIPASRETVKTGYGYTMPDQNGWSRYLHFQSAWAAVFTGLVYVIAGFWSGHFRRNLVPERRDWTWRAYWARVTQYLRGRKPDAGEYNVLQRTAYLAVVFVAFPMVIWTGLAMSPAFVSAVPASVVLLGGRQTARTLHFFISGVLLFFFLVHVLMVALSGFWNRTRGMITGYLDLPEERR